MVNAIVPVDQSRGIVTAAQFEAAMADAKAKATTLAKIVEERQLYTVIQGKKYLEVEAWETIGRAYGYTAKTEWTRPVEGGGWEARAVVIDGFGVEVGAAETECGTKGDKPWDARPSNVQRSMAQTRGISKALRSVLSYVVVLAGYNPTPASEMPHDDDRRPTTRAAPQPARSGPVTEPMRKRLFAIARSVGVDNETLKGLVKGYGVESSADLTREQYDDLCGRLEAGEQDARDAAAAGASEGQE